MTRPGHWQESPGAWRTQPRPVGWKNICKQVKARDHGQCTWIEQANGQRCTAPGTDVDHIGDPADHNLDNLRLLCAPHHDHKTAGQAAAARWAKTRQQRQSRSKPHPGLTL